MTIALKWNEGPITDDHYMVLVLMKNRSIKIAFKAGIKAINKDGSHNWVDDNLKIVWFYEGRIALYNTTTPYGRRLQERIDDDNETQGYTHWLSVPPPPGGWEDERFILNGEIRQCRLAKHRVWAKLRRRD